MQRGSGDTRGKPAPTRNVVPEPKLDWPSGHQGFPSLLTFLVHLTLVFTQGSQKWKKKENLCAPGWVSTCDNRLLIHSAGPGERVSR